MCGTAAGVGVTGAATGVGTRLLHFARRLHRDTVRRGAEGIDQFAIFFW